MIEILTAIGATLVTLGILGGARSARGAVQRRRSAIRPSSVALEPLPDIPDDTAPLADLIAEASDQRDRDDASRDREGPVRPRLEIPHEAQHEPTDAILELEGERIAEFVAKLNRAYTPGSGLRAISWYRTVRTNQNAEGDELSQHLLALAVDVFGRPTTLDEFEHDARAAGLVPVPNPSTNTLHVQAELAGLLARIGVDPADLPA